MASLHLKTALGYMRRSPYQALAAIFVLTLTFFVGTILAVLVYSSTKVLTYVETRPQIIAFLKDEAAPENISSLQSRLTADSRVKEVKYVSKEEALSIYKEATADNPLLSELVSPSIFPASIEFSVKDLNFAQGIIEEVQAEPSVASVGFTASLGGDKNLKDVISRLRTATWYIRIGGGVFVSLLGVTSLLILLFIISMRMTKRKEEIEILNLIGATKKFIKAPIVIESLLYAWGGVFLGWILTLILVLYSAPSVIGYFGQIPVLPRDTVSFLALFGVILVIEMILGFALALSGSALAVSRVKKVR